MPLWTEVIGSVDGTIFKWHRSFPEIYLLCTILSEYLAEYKWELGKEKSLFFK